MPFRGRSASASWHERREQISLGNFEAWQVRVPIRARPGRRSLLIPVVISFIIQVPAVFFRFQPDVGLVPSATLTDGGVLFVSLGLALLGPLALIFARRFPGPVVAVTAAAGATDLLLFGNVDHPPYVALAFAIIGAIVRGARLWAWISVGAAWIATLTAALIVRVAVSPPRIAAVTLGVLIVLGIGETVRTRREQFADMSRRLAERKQSEIQAERVRIARELHDVLAHSLSQINVQAGVGLHLMDKQPDKAKEALASIKDASKTALDEVRSVLGILRAEGGADPSAPLVPEPDLARLAGLAASTESQGVAVDLRNELATPPSAAVQLALYRIVQESLTNVLRHSRATAVTILISEAEDGYHLEVSDNGVGVVPHRHDSGNRGLLGMRERAELLGGSLSAGPWESGGFRVLATIPPPTRGMDA
jgi:signal transduction histidine kinase